MPLARHWSATGPATPRLERTIAGTTIRDSYYRKRRRAAQWWAALMLFAVAKIFSMAGPPLSVVMSVFNAEPFLDDAVSSIRGQSFGDFEFIIVDDGSTDGTADRLARHASLDPRIRVLTQENRGLIASLNRAIAACTAPLIARMDGDDVAMPERFARQVQAFRDAPQVVVIGSAFLKLDEQSRVGQQWLPPLSPAEIHSALKRHNCMANPTCMIRRDAVVAAGAYRRAFLYCEDYDLWLRMSEIGDLLNLPEPLLHYRIYPKRDARYVEQQTLSELGARASAARRRAGLPDAANDADLITRDVLDALGVDRSSIDFEVMRRALQAARRAVGDRELLDDLLELARRQSLIGTRSNLYYWLMRLKVHV
jgi:glycosyltransferase involved in cell wall biosynthesis